MPLLSSSIGDALFMPDCCRQRIYKENLSTSMENLPEDFLLKIFSFLDHQNLATAQQVCRNWEVPASNDMLWLNLFRERWGEDDAAFYAPAGSKSWKDVYEVQDRCGRVGLGLKIIREGVDYYLVHQGEIQRHLGSRRQRKRNDICPSNSTEEEKSSQGILDRILFFIGDLEVASADAKRGRLL